MTDNALHQTKAFTRSLRWVILSVTVLALSACGKSKIITTVDDSADYNSARALPPLTKPILDPAPAPAPILVVEAEPSIEDVIDIEDSPLVEDSLVDEDSPLVEDSLVDEDSPLVEDSLVDEDSLVVEDSLALENATGVDVLQISSSIEATENTMILNVESGFDSAWEYVIDRLSGSDVTVFSRNKSAGSIAIGCAEIGVETAEKNPRQGGWSIFNRNKTRTADYCSLQLDERRGGTVVKVLDRTGRDAQANYAELILSRLVGE